MKKNVPIVFLFLLTILLLTNSCTQEANESPQILSFETLASGQYSGLTEKTNQLINSQEELNSIWQKIYSIQIPAPSAPKIDFSQNSLILAARGEQKTSGYDIKIVDIRASTKSVEVSLEYSSPILNSILLPVLTQPFVLVKTPKINKSVRFIETNK